MNLPLKIWSRKDLQEKIGNDKGINEIYYGILLVMLIYNLFIFFSVRERSYLYYVLYISTHILTSLSIDGLGFRYIWPDIICLTNPSFFLFTVILFFILFTRSFLNARENARVMDKAILAISSLAIIGFLLNLIFPFEMNRPAVYLTLFSLIVALTTGFITLFKGVRSAKFFLISFAIIIFGVTVYILMVLNILPSNIIIDNAAKFSLVMQFIMFSFGLADKINTMKNELKVLNISLEKKVEERTIELREAQKQLLITAHQAGMAEIASNALHNIGNILNSANISSEEIAETLKNSN